MTAKSLTPSRPKTSETVEEKQTHVLNLGGESYRTSTFINFGYILSMSTVKFIDFAQGILVVDGLVDGDEERKGRWQLHSLAQLLMAPVKTTQPFSQVSSASSLQSIPQQLSFIGLIP